MNTMLMQVKTNTNENLSDDQFVQECMDLLVEKYPEISGYQYERVDHETINIMIWGDIQPDDDVDYKAPDGID